MGTWDVGKCVAKTEDLRAGILLALILHRLKRGEGVLLRGHRWVPATREELAQLSGLTREQVRKGIERLKATGLVDSMRTRDYRHHAQVLHLRLSEKGEVWARGEGFLNTEEIVVQLSADEAHEVHRAARRTLGSRSTSTGEFSRLAVLLGALEADFTRRIFAVASKSTLKVGS